MYYNCIWHHKFACIRMYAAVYNVRNDKIYAPKKLKIIRYRRHDAHNCRECDYDYTCIFSETPFGVEIYSLSSTSVFCSFLMRLGFTATAEHCICWNPILQNCCLQYAAYFLFRRMFSRFLIQIQIFAINVSCFVISDIYSRYYQTQILSSSPRSFCYVILYF